MEEIDQKSLTICSGIDYTNIHYQHVVCSDAQTAKVIAITRKIYHWIFRQYIFKLTFIFDLGLAIRFTFNHAQHESFKCLSNDTTDETVCNLS